MPDEVTSSDIARLAGVQPTAVSNWRRRHPDFPRELGGPSKNPVFALPEVEAWLKEKGRLPEDALTTGESYADSARADLPSVVASLLPDGRPDLVLDPMCGTGRMLVAVAQRFGAAVAYVGQDPDPARVDVAARAMADAGAGRAELMVGSPLTDDALARHQRAADTVVCMPPSKSSSLTDDASSGLAWEFGPPSQLDSHLAWLQICYGYLRPGGTAVVPVPSPVAVRSTGRRIRAELLRAGALRQVVALPDEFVPYSSVPWQIWILERPAHRPMYTVRLVDLSRATVPRTTNEWQETYADPTRTHEIASIELLDEDVLLVPSRHVEAPVPDVRPEYDRLRRDLAKATTGLDAKLPSFRRTSGTAPFTMIAVTELIRTGAVRLVDKGAHIEPGDIVVPYRPDRVEVSVIAEPTPDRASGEVLRCEPAVIDPYFLACFLRSENNRQQTSTLGTSRFDLRRALVPRMTIDEQRRYGDAFRRLTALTAQIDQLSALATDAVRTAINGLTSGALMP